MSEASTSTETVSRGEPRNTMRDYCTTGIMGFGFQNDVAVTMSRGFMDDPFVGALIPDTSVRRLFLWCFFTSYFPSWLTGRKTMVRRCFSREMPAMGDTKAATIWFLTSFEIWSLITMAFLAWWNIGMKGLLILLRVLSCFSRAGDCEARIMGKGTKYMKLIAIAVDPSMRNGGLGSLVIQPELDTADSQNLPCYLESSNLKNLTFYKRAGFEVVETITAFGVPITLMKRPKASERAKKSH
ncbi:hypothetical protein Pelo_2346 [Pelomyxa schiedti]|nr:hypothetical protein Pelo_2346 [Pelomyxa schiedti]